MAETTTVAPGNFGRRKVAVALDQGPCVPGIDDKLAKPLVDAIGLGLSRDDRQPHVALKPNCTCAWNVDEIGRIMR